MARYSIRLALPGSAKEIDPISAGGANERRLFVASRTGVDRDHREGPTITILLAALLSTSIAFPVGNVTFAPPTSDAGGGNLSSAPPAPSSPVRATTPAAETVPVVMPTREIVVEARAPAPPGDPLQAINARSFAVTQKVDEAVVGPIARGYEHTVPQPLRSGVRNFLNNTREPVVFLSFLLELKPGKAGETFGRFAVNTTLGIAGVFDIAKRKPFHLPRRPNGLADALGYYGVKPGPFLFLPLIGPTTLRDALGGAVDRLVLPLAVGTPFNQFAYAVGTGTLSALDRRIEFDGQLQELRDQNNPYAARRSLYLRQRQAEIDGLHSHRQPAKVALGDPVASPTPSDVGDSKPFSRVAGSMPLAISTPPMATDDK